MMRTADVVTALVLAGLGGLVLFDSVRIGVGWGTDGPRSGFLPFWLSIFLIVSCAGIAVRALRRNERAPFVTRARVRPVIKVLFPALAMVLATGFIGLYVASALYIGLSMRWIGRHSWLLTVFVSIGIPVVTFVVFETWFLVPMPKGPLEAWLGY